MHVRKSLWVMICVGFLMLSRVPAILCPYELNRDESQMAAQAMRYARDLTPWRSVEGETNGPLDSWFLMPAHGLGIPLNYRTLHILSALCLAATLLATYAAARRLTGDTPALVGLAAGSWWLALAPVEDFVHYSSELVPILLLSLALATLLRGRCSKLTPVERVVPNALGGLPGQTSALGTTRSTLDPIAALHERPMAIDSNWRLGLAGGILLGLAPWAKLQAGPVALALGIWALGDGLLDKSAPIAARHRYAAALIAGAMLPSVLLLAWVVAAGAGEEFWRVYIIGGLYHGRSRAWGVHLDNMKDLVFWRASSPWFWDISLLTCGAAWMRRRGGSPGMSIGAVLLVVLWLAAGVFVSLRPITQWTHYVLFCLAPLVLGAAACAQVLVGDRPAAGSDRHRSQGWLMLALGLMPLPIANFIHYHYYRAASEMLFSGQSHAFDSEIFLVKAVRHFVPQPQSLAVWGWNPSLYVDLGLPPATRNAVCAFLTDENPSRDFLRAAYMRDLEQSRPEVIVDVEDYVFRGQRKTSPDTFTALAAYLQQHYLLQGHGEPRRTRDYSLVIDIYRRKTD